MSKFRSLEGILNSSNSKSEANPYFQRKLPESAPTQIRNNLAHHLGCNKVSNQQWSAYLDLDCPDCLNIFASRNKNLKRDRSVQQLNSLNKTRWRFFVDYLQPFTPCWKNLIKKIQKQGKTSGKWMTCSFL